MIKRHETIDWIDFKAVLPALRPSTSTLLPGCFFSERVLVFTTKGYVTPGTLMVKDGRASWGNDEEVTIEDVAFWAPLPRGPQ